MILDLILLTQSCKLPGMNIASKSHFSKMCSVSRAAITKAARENLIGVTDGGDYTLQIGTNGALLLT